MKDNILSSERFYTFLYQIKIHFVFKSREQTHEVKELILSEINFANMIVFSFIKIFHLI